MSTDGLIRKYVYLFSVLMALVKKVGIVFSLLNRKKIVLVMWLILASHDVSIGLIYRDKTVYIQFSRHQELKVIPSVRMRMRSMGQYFVCLCVSVCLSVTNFSC